MMNKSGLLCVLLLALPLCVNAGIYKWKDAEGVTRYSDMPPSGNVPYESLQGRKATAIKAVAKPAVVGEVATEKVAEAEETPEQIHERERADEIRLKARQQNCLAARANLKTFEQGGRVIRMNADGEREYYDDAGLAQGIEKARQDIQEYCT